MRVCWEAAASACRFDQVICISSATVFCCSQAASVPPSEQQQQGIHTAPQPAAISQPKLQGVWAKGGQAAWAGNGTAAKQEALAKRMGGLPQQLPRQQQQHKGSQGSSAEGPAKRISLSPTPWSAPASRQPSSHAQASWPSLKASSSTSEAKGDMGCTWTCTQSRG